MYKTAWNCSSFAIKNGLELTGLKQAKRQYQGPGKHGMHLTRAWGQVLVDEGR